MWIDLMSWWCRLFGYASCSQLSTFEAIVLGAVALFAGFLALLAALAAIGAMLGAIGGALER